ncbi:MAG: tautomerase family protein [Lachnospiraceae bacterium]
MPLVKIEILKGHSFEYKKTMLESIHEALENALSIPDWDRFQRLYELENDCFERNSTKTAKFTIIELTLFPGRSKEVKKSVIHEIVSMLGSRLEIQPDDIFIIINEPPLDNWGMRGTQASELELQYKQS